MRRRQPSGAGAGASVWGLEELPVHRPDARGDDCDERNHH